MKKRVYIFALALLVPSLFASSVQAITRYVRNGSGNGCSNGSINYNVTTDGCGIGGSAQIYTTIAAGLAVTQAGDTLNIRAGTYNETILESQLSGKSGAGVGSETIIQAYGTEAVRMTSIFLGGAAGTNTSYIIFRADRTAHNFTVVGIPTGYAIQIGQAGNTGRVHHVTFDGIETLSSGGIQIGDAGNDSNTYRYLKLHPATTGTCDTGDPNLPDVGIYVQTSGNIFEYNEIYNYTGSGIQNYYQSPGGPANNNIYRYNYFHNNAANQPGGGCLETAFGLAIAAGNNIQVYGNVIANNGAGLDLQSGSSGSPNVAYNNTIYANSTPHPWGQYPGIQVHGATTTVVNNIVYNNPGGTIDGVTSGVTMGNNLFTDPSFINAAGGDFRLNVGSTAINQGTPNIAPGIVIPACSGGTTTGCYNGTAPDIGALETGVPSAGGGPPVLTANPSIVTTGAAVSVTVDDDDLNERIESAADWVGMFVPGAAATVFIDWFWMNGSKTSPSIAISDAVINFTAPSTPGSYEFRFYQNGSDFEADRLATAPFTVIAPGIVMKFNVSALKIGPSVTWKVGTP